METATVISLLYGRFIEVWRQKAFTGQNTLMTRLLIRNSSHEVRTPLNAIINYLEMALESDMSEDTRELLRNAHTASRSLVYVIDDLLNLTKAEDRPISSVGDNFDLGATVIDVVTAFRKEAIRKGLYLTVSSHQGIPEMVQGDSARLRQVLSNITSNAFQHSIDGGIKVDIRPIHTTDSTSVIGITVQDAGVGMSESQLDGLFQEFEQVVDENDRSSSEDTTPSSDGAKTPTGLGVGLAVVARYVRNMNGILRVNSQPGKGTIFGLELPFQHAMAEDKKDLISTTTRYQLPPEMSDTDISTEGEMINQGSRENPKPPMQQLRKLISLQLPVHATADSETLSPVDNQTTEEKSFNNERSSTLPRPSLSVLIAEDNPINVKLLAKRLVKNGHQVEVASNGQECYDYFSSNSDKVDVILMDIQVSLCIFLLE
jgi:nitrogen-specific signal transduction histidine kinase/CheY-like chemotaxis protein